MTRAQLTDKAWEFVGPHLPIGRCGKEWTDDGAAHEVRSLKRRAVNATRPVPIPPQFVHILLAHMERFGVSPDGRVFRNETGNHVDTAAYGTTWARARESALTPTEYASGLALFRHYAKFLDGVQEQSNSSIEQSMQEWDRISNGPPIVG